MVFLQKYIFYLMGYTVFTKPKPRNENLTKKPVFRQPSLAGTRYLITYQAYDEATPHSLEMNDRTDFSIDLPANSHYYVWVNAYKGNCVSPYTDKDHIDIV